MTNADLKRQAIKAREGQTREHPLQNKKDRAPYQHGERVHTFDRTPANPHSQATRAFTGKGFMPNVMNSHGLVTLPELSATTLENEGVHGRDGMLPPSGRLGALQKGQALDEGAGGAGSFATVASVNSKMGG